MPVSDLHGFPAIMAEVQRLNPRTVLDLGVGFGLIGVGVRQILDAQHGRIAPYHWSARIIGKEIFAKYQNPVWQAYTRVMIEDFVNGETAMGYDLVLMIDSLEHVEPERGRVFLRDLVRDNHHVIVSVPNGRMDQGTVFGNEYETHRWTFIDLEEFEPYKYKVLHRGVCTVVSIEGGLK